MKQKTVKYCFLITLLAALFTLTACQKEEPEKETKKKAEDIVIKTDDIEPENTNDETALPDQEVSMPLVLEGLAEPIQALIAPVQNTGALVSVYVENLSTGAQISVNSQPMQAASLIKLYIAGCAYEQISVLQAQESYEGETETLLSQMITVSDNDAANTLVTRLGSGDSLSGMSVINQFCQSHGFADTHMGRLLLAPNDTDDNYTSVNDCGKFLREVHANTLPGAANILSLMKQQERTGKLPAGIPVGVTTANKTGELYDVENDTAIIFPENGAYSVCVMMSGLSDTYTARTTITELSAQIYQFMCP